MSFDFTWIIAIISITGSFLNVRKSVISFYLWALTEVMCFVIDFKNKQFGRAFLDTFSFFMNVYGIVTWSREKTNLKEDGGRCEDV